MNLINQYHNLFAYHFDTTFKLLDCAQQISESKLVVDPGYSHGSIHNLFFHLLRTDISWRTGLETGQQVSGIRASDYPDMPSLRIGFKNEQIAWREYLDSLDDAQIGCEINITNWRGVEISFKLWHILQHVVLHGMQHHSEIAQQLTENGCSPGDIDFIFYT